MVGPLAGPLACLEASLVVICLVGAYPAAACLVGAYPAFLAAAYPASAFGTEAVRQEIGPLD